MCIQETRSSRGSFRNCSHPIPLRTRCWPQTAKYVWRKCYKDKAQLIGHAPTIKFLRNFYLNRFGKHYIFQLLKCRDSVWFRIPTRCHRHGGSLFERWVCLWTLKNRTYTPTTCSLDVCLAYNQSCKALHGTKLDSLKCFDAVNRNRSINGVTLIKFPL